TGTPQETLSSNGTPSARRRISMRPETAAALYDMSQAADRIVEATQGKVFDDYQGDWYFQSAVERQFEILGEALARIRDLERPIFEQFPEAAKVVALRNVIIH